MEVIWTERWGDCDDGKWTNPLSIGLLWPVSTKQLLPCDVSYTCVNKRATQMNETCGKRVNDVTELYTMSCYLFTNHCCWPSCQFWLYQNQFWLLLLLLLLLLPAPSTPPAPPLLVGNNKLSKRHLSLILRTVIAYDFLGN